MLMLAELHAWETARDSVPMENGRLGDEYFNNGGHLVLSARARALAGSLSMPRSVAGGGARGRSAARAACSST